MRLKLKHQLVFAGSCEEAFKVYEKAFDGKIVFIFRKKEDKSLEINECESEKISHMVLVCDDFELGGEDAPMGDIINTGNSQKNVLVFYDLDKIHYVFDILSDRGVIVTPLQNTFFSEAIGEVIDKFGIRWLIMMTDENYSE